MNTIRAVVALGFASVPLLQGGNAPNLLIVSPSVIAFSATGVGSTSQLYSNFSIYNPGTAPVTITAFTIKGPQPGDFSVTPGSCPFNPSSLGPGQNCYLSGSFTPSAVGLRLATVVVQDDGGAPQSVLLSGEGLATVKSVKLLVPEVTFPSTPVGVPAQSAPQALVQLQNSGNVAVTVRSTAIVGPDATEFQIVSDTCSPAIPVAYTCYLYVSFSPTAAGTRAASLQFVDDAQGGGQSVPLIGVGTAAPGALQFFPAAVAFGPTATSNSLTTLIIVENNGSEPVTLSHFGITGPNASDFSVVQNYCRPVPYTLAGAGECRLEVQFTPAAMGARLANLEIADTAPGSPQMVPLEGVGVGSQINLSFSETPVPLSVTAVGQTDYASIDLQNLGPGIAQLSYRIQGIDAADFTVTPACPVLDPNEVCNVGFTFTPSLPGIRVARLVAADSVLGQSQSVFLIGSGEPVGSALSAGTAVFLPVGVGDTSQTTLSVNNQTASAVTITQFTVTGAAASDFDITKNGCRAGTIVGENSSCTMDLSFTPSAAGPRVAEITVGYAGEISPLSVPLAGVGLPPSRTISFGIPQLTFKPQPVGAPVDATASITNTGSQAISIASLSLGGANSGDYAIIGNQCPQPPATLAPAISCQVSVQFTPAAAGTRLGRLQVADNASGSPQSLPLVGFGDNSSPALSIVPAALSFISEPLGSSVQDSIELQPVSGIPVSLSGFQITGPDAGDFTLVNDCPPTLTSLCYLYVTFTPSVTGVRFAELQIQDNAAGTPQIIPLSGFGTAVTPPAGVITLSPIPLTFPQVQGIGYTASGSVSIGNTGTADVLLTGFQIAERAKDFGIQENSCPLSPAPLAPGISCNVTIEFTPSATGTRVATFEVTDNATGSPQSISIVGEGAAAVKKLSASPSSVTFSPTAVGSTNYNGSVVVYNTGTLPVTFKGFGISGPDPGDFSVGNNYCSLPLSPGYTCEIYLSFTPSATGTRTAQLDIVSDATPAVQTVQLTGTGQ